MVKIHKTLVLPFSWQTRDSCLAIYSNVSLLFCRKKYVKSCRIRHTYGEEEESNVLEEEAVLLAENAVRNGVEQGTAPQIPDHEIDAPESAEVTLGGKKCKWCGSTTHSRKTHKDCPHNPKNAPNST